MDPNFFDHYPFQQQDWRKIVKKLSVPLLLVTGDVERGAIVTPAIGMEVVQLLEKGEFGHISAAGHCVRYEQYQPYLRMVSLFLARNLPA
jgi:pimeloyl-ACP methyl ester carboxylesterase